jgi:dsDNA-specific endonuclease/ATPase MutS2
MSNTGSTCFIEPSSIRKLQDEMSTLKIEEENEVIIILYTLTALIYDNLSSIKLNMEALEKLDFLFAKAKLSFAMKATQIRLTDTKQIRLIGARHPLIQEDLAIPLNFALGDGIRGIIITGPNTGGKTVAIKTVGLLSLMTQSGLHIPADSSSSMCIFDRVLCDIGDGQSITENLSTFSAHMTNIIDILSQTSTESLILLDELGSGTDPAEGMGIAMAVLEELVSKNCLFTATTHYPEIKDFAENTPSLINARMAFDKETLLPLYRLEIGEAGESCALHIAQRLGMSDHILSRAREITYSGVGQKAARNNADVTENKSESKIQEVKALEVEEEAPEIQVPLRSEGFNIGDTVTVYPQKQIGIVYARTNKKGEIGVQIQGEKKLIAHKRIKLKTPASELYPDDYDFSIIFDSVADRKARHQMNRKLVKGVTVPTQKWG